MRISASDFILFCHDPAENVRRLSRIVPEVELMIDGDAWDNSSDGWSCQKEQLQGCGTRLSIHPPAWDVNISAPIRALRDTAMELNRKAAQFGAAVGARQIVFHPGYYDSASSFSRTKAIDHCFEGLEDLIRTAKPLGMTIGFENIAGPSMALFTQEEYVHVLDGIDPCVKYLLDVGHANMNAWDIPAVIDSTAERVCAFHLHDNDGTGDAHHPICTGTIPWENVFSSMRQLPKDVDYILEYATGTPLSELERGKDILLQHLEF